MKKQLSFLCTAFILTACSTGSIFDAIPDRAPDYRQSSVSRKIEVPPDLSSDTVNDQLAVSDFTPANTATYSEYAGQRVQRNSRGFIEVLPPLYGVQVVENAGELPYIQTAADPGTAWQIVKKYWLNNGVRLAIDNPGIGIMETDWLDNRANAPKSGIGGFLNSMFGFLNDSDQRDRYRMRFARNSQGGTDITLIYSKTENVPQYDLQSGKEPAGFKWQLSDSKNPELQLEMTRRIALFISNELKKSAAGTGSAQLAQLNSGELVLVFEQPYASAWQHVGGKLQSAGYTVAQSEYQTGTYRINANGAQFLVRLGANDQNQTVAAVQTTSGKPAPESQTRAILQAISH